MITDKATLKEYIRRDREANVKSKRSDWELAFRRGFPYQAFGYLKLVRKTEYAIYRRDHASNRGGSFLFAQKIKLLDRRRNTLGLKLGLDIPAGSAEAGIRIAHPNVILNGHAGEGCVFHGSNVLGNKGTGQSDAIPRLGRGVDVGVGAIVIGKVEIADGCVIGAGAVVTRSFLTPGTVIAGVPAKEIRK